MYTVITRHQNMMWCRMLNSQASRMAGAFDRIVML